MSKSGKLLSNEQPLAISFRIRLSSKQTQINNPFDVKKILEINYSGYVYDLTTENHHFAAGVGNLIVHNTDSVFYTFNLQTPDGNALTFPQEYSL